MFRLSPKAEIRTADQIGLPTGEYQQVQYVTARFVRGKTPKRWRDFPDSERNWAALAPEEAQAMAEQLKNAVISGRVQGLWLSVGPWGEDDFLSVDFEQGRAALLYNACDECAAAPCDPDRPDAWEDAHADIGGQTPVPLACVLENMEKAARVILYFLENGKLSPETKWAVDFTGDLPWV